MNYSPEEEALVWLCCQEFELRERVALLHAAPSPQELFLHFENFFEEVILKETKSVYKIGDLAQRREELARYLDQLEKFGAFAVTVVSDDYPKLLLNANPPLVLFGAGNRSLLKERMFTIVGSRVTPAWAEAFGSKISGALADYFAIVTGLAEGGDRAAISGALPKKKIISVLPCGLDQCYPAAHAALKQKILKDGLLLSEYPLGDKPKKHVFHARNRILAGLSEGVLVLSAASKSGALITANFALDYNRNVFALPCSIGVARGEGCNELIKNGAFLVTKPSDILDCYGILPKAEKPILLSKQEEQLLDLLKEDESFHIAVLAERLGLPVYEVSTLLAALEVKGMVVKTGGNQYAFAAR